MGLVWRLPCGKVSMPYVIPWRIFGSGRKRPLPRPFSGSHGTLYHGTLFHGNLTTEPLTTEPCGMEPCTMEPCAMESFSTERFTTETLAWKPLPPNPLPRNPSPQNRINRRAYAWARARVVLVSELTLYNALECTKVPAGASWNIALAH